MTAQKTQKPSLAFTLIGMIIFLIAFPLLPMMISGDWTWWEAWTYVLITVVGFVLSRIPAVKRHPDILQERSRSMTLQDAKAWDKPLVSMIPVGTLFLLVVAGLDRLLHWTLPFELVIKVAAAVMIILGYALGSWAMLENRFFSGVVRIQKDRGHHVIHSGPYRFIRHPGYAGAILSYLFTPILLDSIWAFIPALFLMSVLVLRTALEDRTLQEELPDYREFTKKTKYRLIPGVW